MAQKGEDNGESEEIKQIDGFLGGEFLTWLWFKSDCMDGVCSSLRENSIIIRLGDQLRLDTYLVDAERSDFTGGDPASSPEAKTALRQGKRVSRVKLDVETASGAQAWSFAIIANTLGLSAVKVAATLDKEDDVYEVFSDRMMEIDELEMILETIYQEFIKIRISPEWTDVCLPAMRAWVQRDGESSKKDYPSRLLKFAEEAEYSTFIDYSTPASGLAYEGTDEEE